MTAPIYRLERVCRLQHREGNWDRAWQAPWVEELDLRVWRDQEERKLYTERALCSSAEYWALKHRVLNYVCKATDHGWKNNQLTVSEGQSFQQRLWDMHVYKNRSECKTSRRGQDLCDLGLGKDFSDKMPKADPFKILFCLLNWLGKKARALKEKNLIRWSSSKLKTSLWKTVRRDLYIYVHINFACNGKKLATKNGNLSAIFSISLTTYALVYLFHDSHPSVSGYKVASYFPNH